eukprot:gene3276-10004_t
MLLALSVAAFVAVSTHTADAAGPATLVATLATPHAPHPVLAVLQEQLQQEQEHAKGGVLCQLCIDEVLALINEVLNDILNGVILNSCGKLCGNIPNNKTKELCTVACDIVGIKKLVQYLNSTDPDEIYICSEIKLCGMGNCTGHGDGSTCLDITSITAPPVVTIDAAVNVDVAIDVKQALATGMTRIQIIFPPDKKGQSQVPDLRVDGDMQHGAVQCCHTVMQVPDLRVDGDMQHGAVQCCHAVMRVPRCSHNVQQTDQLNINWPAGPQSLQVQIPEQTLTGVGNYSVSVEICEGSCGSTKPNASPYDKKDVKFQAVRHGPGPAPPTPPGPAPPPGPPSNDYEDPGASGTCHTGETALQITGVPGSFCSPSCSATSPCPAAPAGSSAQGQCVLEKPPSKTPSNCALICKPGAAGACPAKATCQSIQGTGICTYAN